MRRVPVGRCRSVRLSKQIVVGMTSGSTSLPLALPTHIACVRLPVRCCPNDTVSNLVVHVSYDSQKIKLANFYRASGDGACIDLGDTDWKMITATNQGWGVVRQSGPPFYRMQHHEPLVEPHSRGQHRRVVQIRHYRDGCGKAADHNVGDRRRSKVHVQSVSAKCMNIQEFSQAYPTITKEVTATRPVLWRGG